MKFQCEIIGVKINYKIKLYTRLIENDIFKELIQTEN